MAILARSLILTVLLFSILFAGLWFLFEGSNPCRLVSTYSCELNSASTTLALLPFGLVGLWFLFPAIAIAVISLFSDAIVDTVEDRHYPGQRARREIGWTHSIGLALRSAGRLLLWNIIALPAYLILLFTAVGPFILFMVINAIALGRDLGEMVAVRHMGKGEKAVWLKSTRLTRLAMGAVASAAFLVPILNLFAPILGAAMATHIFHQTRD